MEGLRADLPLGDLASSRKSKVEVVLKKISNHGDQKYLGVLDAYREGSLFLYEDQIYYNLGTYENDDLDEFVQIAEHITRQPLNMGDTKHPETGHHMIPIEDVEMIEPSRQIRKLIVQTKMAIALRSSDPEVQLTAIKKSAFNDGAAFLLPILQQIHQNEKTGRLKRTALESDHIITIREGDPKDWSRAVEGLGELDSLRAEELLKEQLKIRTSDEQQRLLKDALASIQGHQFRVEIFNLFKSALSSGSILILMALGLSITFGMMGIINMAHGELMMIGAYTTYVMQLVFGHSSSSPNNVYFLLALPLSFIVAMLVGALIELTIVRKLYKYPLESLLATYGMGLILIQVVRIIFGDNCPANSPTWLQGGVEVFNDMTLQYNRLFVFVLTIVCLGVVVYIFRFTSLGLQMKASMQNRDMASAMGINTRKVDLLTFMLGSGMAGVAGNALVTLGGITPDMGQNYIVDSFLVVVTGGVGNVYGVVCSGLGLGVMNKTLESLFFGAVWSKILVLLAVIVFIQFRPSGLFAAKGRSVD